MALNSRIATAAFAALSLGVMSTVAHGQVDNQQVTAKVTSNFTDNVRTSYNAALLSIALQHGRIISASINTQMTVTVGGSSATFNDNGSATFVCNAGDVNYSISGESYYEIRWIPRNGFVPLSAESDETYNGSGVLSMSGDGGKTDFFHVSYGPGDLNSFALHRHHLSTGWSHDATLDRD